MADKLKQSQLARIVVPAITDAEYSTGLADAFDKINDNFKKIASLPFLQGVQGDSYQLEEYKIWEKDETGNWILTEDGKVLLDSIFGIDTTKNGNSFNDVRTCIGQFMPEEGGVSPIDFFKNGNDIVNNSLYFYVIKDDTGNVIEKQLGQYYYFVDGRLKEIGDIYNSENASSILSVFNDYTGFYQYKYDIENSNSKYIKVEILPTIYYDQIKNDICWKFNGNKTGISALGIKGADGNDAIFSIVLVDLTSEDGVYNNNSTSGEVIGILDTSASSGEDVQWKTDPKYFKTGKALIYLCGKIHVENQGEESTNPITGETKIDELTINDFAFGEINKQGDNYIAFWDPNCVFNKVITNGAFTQYFYNMGTVSYPYNSAYFLAIPSIKDRVSSTVELKQHAHIIKGYEGSKESKNESLNIFHSDNAFDEYGNQIVGASESIEAKNLNIKNYNVNISKSLTTNGGANILGGATISGNSTFNNNLSVGGTLGVNGALTVDKKITGKSGLDITSGGATISGNSTFNNNLSVKGTLGVTGKITGNSGIKIYGSSSEFYYGNADATTYTNILKVGPSAVSVEGPNGNLSVVGTLGVTGAATLGSLAVGGTLNVNGTATLSGITRITNNTDSTGTTSGALVVTGGVGIGKNLRVGGTLGVTGAATLGSLAVKGTLGVTGAATLGSLAVGGTLNVNGAATLSGITRITNNTDSTGTTSGALVVSGGVGIGKNLNVGGKTKITNIESSSSTTSGALVVSGGVGIRKNLQVKEELTTYKYINIAGCGDATNEVGGTNHEITTLADTNKLGHIYLGAPPDDRTSPLHRLLMNRHSIQAYTTYGTTTNEKGETVYTYKNPDVSYLYLNPCGGNVSISKSGSTTTINGDLGVTGDATFSGKTKIKNSSISTSTTSGALVVTGGVGIGEKLYVGDTSTFQNGLNVGSTLDVRGDVTLESNLTVENTLGVSGDATIKGGATINEGATIKGEEKQPGGTGLTVYGGKGVTGSSGGTGAIIEGGIGASGKQGGIGLVVRGGTSLAGGERGLGIKVENGGVIYSGTGATSDTNILKVNSNGVSVEGGSGNLSVKGITTITNDTNSSIATDGALVVTGGVGIGNNLNVGGYFWCGGSFTVEAEDSHFGGNIHMADSGELTAYLDNVDSIKVESKEIISTDKFVAKSIDSSDIGYKFSVGESGLSFIHQNGSKQDTNLFSVNTDGAKIKGATTSTPGLIVRGCDAPLLDPETSSRDGNGGVGIKVYPGLSEMDGVSTSLETHGNVIFKNDMGGSFISDIPITVNGNATIKGKIIGNKGAEITGISDKTGDKDSCVGLTVIGGTYGSIDGSTGKSIIATGDVDVKGKVEASQGFFQSSDERLKNFKDDVLVDLDKLSSIPKKYFTWKTGDTKSLNIGTSAQEIQKLYPELVHEDSEGNLTVAYDKLSIIALKAIDELQIKNKELEKRIEKLEKLLK